MPFSHVASIAERGQQGSQERARIVVQKSGILTPRVYLFGLCFDVYKVVVMASVRFIPCPLLFFISAIDKNLARYASTRLSCLLDDVKGRRYYKLKA